MRGGGGKITYSMWILFALSPIILVLVRCCSSLALPSLPLPHVQV